MTSGRTEEQRTAWKAVPTFLLSNHMSKESILTPELGLRFYLHDGIIVLVLVHDLTFAYTSSCTYNVYRFAVNEYDLSGR